VAWDARARPSRPPTPSPDAPLSDRGDRFLVAASFVFALAVGNHSLTLLLAIPVGLYVVAVDPGIWRRGRLVWSCIGVLALTLVAIYLELPLRSAPGPFRAGLVYGTPYTWDGFRYIVLAEQFQGSLQDPFGELPRKFADLVGLAVAQFGILAPLIPIGFLATAIRRPRYALLTGSAAAITCFFAASYVNADINRYYLGPALMAWTWLAILAGEVLDTLTRAAADAAPDEPSNEATVATRSAAAAVLLALILLVPTAFALPDRYRAVDLRGDHAAATWTDHVLEVMAPNAVIVSWWSYSTPLWYAQRVEGRRPDITIVDDRTRLDDHLGGLTDVIDADLRSRPVYVIRLDRSEVALLAQRYQLDYIDGSDASSLTRVMGPRIAGG
jgi:diacylglycerol kinase